MGVGLWLSAASARSLVDDDRFDDFAAWLHEEQLVPFTFNGFPHGDFHQEKVKHLVYLPDWAEDERARYTRDLIGLLVRLMGESTYGSISTLPLCWGRPPASIEHEQAAAMRLAAVAEHLAAVEQETGKRIVLSLEPEPGCQLSTSRDVVRFYEERLLAAGVSEQVLRRHVGVCHDVCHAVVMGESQADVLTRYAAAGIAVGKIQISSAIVADFDSADDDQGRGEMLDELASFAEDRYLHQVGVVDSAGRLVRFFEDLPLALDHARDNAPPSGRWCVHFHVPVYLREFGRLFASQSAIDECLASASPPDDRPLHFEVETYAWNVLPVKLQKGELSEGIAEELAWFERRLAGC